MNINLTDKTVKSIILLDKCKNMNNIAKLSDTTYSYQVKLLKELEKLGVVTSKKTGRIRKIYLTDKGKKLKWHLEQIKML